VILVGLFLLSTRGGLSSPNIGDLMVLGMALAFGLYNVVAKKFTSNISPMTLANTRMFFGDLLVIIIVAFLLGRDSFNALVHYPLIIIVGSFIIYLYTYTLHVGIKNVGATYTSALYTSAAIFSSIFAILLLHEQIASIQYFGGILIVAGLMILVFANSGNKSLTTQR
jgi:drug/metabolite transporter (DMT)-like permease